MRFVTTAHLQRAFALPRVLAAELVADGIRHDVRHRWQPWAWVLAWLGVPTMGAGLGGSAWPTLHHGGVFILIVAPAGWCLPVQRPAGEGMLAAAEDNARRISGSAQRS